MRLIDAPRADLFDRLKDGDPLTIEGGTVISEMARRSSSGHVLGAEELAAQLDRQREEIDDALADFAENTVDPHAPGGRPAGRRHRLPAQPAPCSATVTS